MDRTADPCDGTARLLTFCTQLFNLPIRCTFCEDFFQYACGAWNKKHVIPEDKPSVSTFDMLSDQQQIILRKLLEEPINSESNDNEATIKAKMFYKSCIDLRKSTESHPKILLA
jgi:predicted metalloendopeptidase